MRHRFRDHVFKWRAPNSRNPGELWPDEVVLEFTLAAYQECVDPALRIIDRPDRPDRRNPAVDGVLASSSRRIAVEITEVQTFADQLKTRSEVDAYLGPIEAELALELPLGTSCELPVHPLPPGHDWKKIGQLLATCIMSAVESLEPGAYRQSIDGVPFAFWLAYHPGSPLPFRFSRSNPSYAEIQTGLAAAMVKALGHKRPQLRNLADRGDRTVLVLTSHDANFYRVTWDSAYNAFRHAQALVGSDHVRDVLFSFTGDCSFLYCLPFKGDPLSGAP